MRHLKTIIIGLFVVAVMVVVIRSAWLCDDACIFFRTVDNIAHGYGPTWNTSERLQAFTGCITLDLLPTVTMRAAVNRLNTILLTFPVLMCLVTRPPDSHRWIQHECC